MVIVQCNGWSGYGEDREVRPGGRGLRSVPKGAAIWMKAYKMLADFPGEVGRRDGVWFCPGKMSKGQESRWREWTFSHEDLGVTPEASLCCSSPGPALAALTERWRHEADAHIKFTGCSECTERPCGSCHPSLLSFLKTACRHLVKEGRTRNDVAENEIPRVFESCCPVINSISLAKLIELIYL